MSLGLKIIYCFNYVSENLHNLNFSVLFMIWQTLLLPLTKVSSFHLVNYVNLGLIKVMFTCSTKIAVVQKKQTKLNEIQYFILF